MTRSRNTRVNFYEVAAHMFVVVVVTKTNNVFYIALCISTHVPRVHDRFCVFGMFLFQVQVSITKLVVCVPLLL